MYKNEQILNYVFECKDKLKIEDNELRRVNLGELNLPTGRIVATDPLTLNDPNPFTVSVKPGKYPVSVFIEDKYDMPALAALFFTGKPAVKWEMALVGKEDASKLKKKNFYGYGVDAGTGSFMDASTVPIIDNLDEEGLFGAVDDAFYGDEDKCYVNYTIEPYYFEEYVKNPIPFVPDTTVAMFNIDDGLYPSYFGYDEDGNVCCLVTDFMMLNNDEGDEWNDEDDDKIFDYGDDVKIDISALDTTQKPFPFYGAGLARHFEYDWITVKFRFAPDNKTIKKIIDSSPLFHIDKDDFHDSILSQFGNYGIGMYIEACYSDETDIEKLKAFEQGGSTDEMLLEYEKDIIAWLLEVHTYCPIQFVVRNEDGEAGGTVFSKWHYDSLKIDKLPEALEMEFEKCTKKERKYADEIIKTITGFWEKSEWGQVADEEWDSESEKLANTISKYIDNGDSEALVNAIEQSIAKGEAIEAAYAIGHCDDEITDEFGEDILCQIAELLLSNEESAKELCSYPISIANISIAIMQSGNQELLNKLASVIYIHENLIYFVHNIYLKTQNEIFPTGNWQLIIHLYQYMLYLLSGKALEDLSFYCNALYICQHDNTGLPVNTELNNIFLSNCLPYAEQNPAIWFNAGCLYVEMNQHDEALEVFKKYTAAPSQNKEAMLQSLKTEKMFEEFRKHKGVQEFIDSI